MTDAGGAGPFNGKQDELVVFNRLLNNYEINQIRNGTFAGAASPPVYANINNFSGDATCLALWRFENGALLADSKSTNTLVAAPNVPTADTVHFVEGGASANFVAASSQGLKITDANLAAGFPFKNGDTGKKVTFCFWYQPTTNPAGDKGLISKRYNGSSDAYSFVIDHVGNTLWIIINSVYYWGNIFTFVPGTLYHLAIELDSSGAVGWAKVIVYDSSVSCINTYLNAALPAKCAPDTGDLCIGSVGNNAYYINGNMDEVVVFDRLLSDTEVDAIRKGTYRTITTWDFTTVCAAVSAVSTPQVVITRPFTFPSCCGQHRF